MKRLGTLLAIALLCALLPTTAAAEGWARVDAPAAQWDEYRGLWAMPHSDLVFTAQVGYHGSPESIKLCVRTVATEGTWYDWTWELVDDPDWRMEASGRFRELPFAIPLLPAGEYEVRLEIWENGRRVRSDVKYLGLGG